jgi:undecaprenyl-diphosphatase
MGWDMSGLLSLNWQLFEDLNQHATKSSLLGHLMIVGAQDVIFVLPLLLLALWFGMARWSPLAKTEAAADNGVGKQSARSPRVVAQQLALMTAVAVVVALVANQVAAKLFPEQRPFITHPSQVLPHQLITHPADQSFPSDHETVASAIAIMLIVLAVWLRTSFARLRRLALLLALLAVVCALYIGVARVYVGVHYPGDILGGGVCGAIGAAVAVWLRRFVAPLLSPIVSLAERLKLA